MVKLDLFLCKKKTISNEFSTREHEFELEPFRWLIISVEVIQIHGGI